MPRTLDRRLSTIKDMIDSPYDHIWDCCCDHGDLGISLLETPQTAVIHFVDIVDSIIQTLNRKLQSLYPESTHWQTHLADLSTLELNESHAKHLVIIAGIGGDLTIELVRGILKHNPHTAIEFILCPVRHEYRVRSSVKSLGLHLMNEALIKDKKLFYEVIHIGHEGQSIEPCGSSMWDLTNIDHLAYLDQKIAHYQRASQSNPKINRAPLLDYLSIKSKAVNQHS